MIKERCKSRWIIWFILLVFAITIIVIVLGNSKEQQEITVHFIDVGQGDSIFIDAGEYDILIDAGDNKHGTTVVNYLDTLNTDDIELLVSTHPHADHIGGLDDVLAAFDVEKVIYSGKSAKSKTYKEYWEAVKAEECPALEDSDMNFDIFEGAVFKVIEMSDKWENTNNYSVVCALDYNNIEVLFTGDMENTAEHAGLDRFFDVEVLKVGHHGSRTASSMEFLNIVKPEYSIISCGKDNRYGHPHSEAMDNLNSIGSQILRTDLQGTIVAVIDGKTVRFNSFQ